MERQTFMEQLNKRVSNIENYLEKIGPVEKLFERIGMLEENIYTTKNNFNFKEACMYLGISESLMYKLTCTLEIPHYKLRGRLLYFAKDELDNWLHKNRVETAEDIRQKALENDIAKPYFEKDRYGKKKRK